MLTKYVSDKPPDRMGCLSRNCRGDAMRRDVDRPVREYDSAVPGKKVVVYESQWRCSGRPQHYFNIRWSEVEQGRAGAAAPPPADSLSGQAAAQGVPTTRLEMVE